MNSPLLMIYVGLLIAAALIVLMQVILDRRKPEKEQEPTVAEFNFDDWITIIDSRNTMFALCYFHPNGNLETVHYLNPKKSGTRKFVEELVINFDPSVVIRRTEDLEDNRYQISLPPGWRIKVDQHSKPV